MKKTSNLMTIGGIMAAFGTGLIGVPQIVLQTYAIVVKDGPPHWFTAMILPMLLLGILMTTMGTAILGVAGKGQDEHSTPAQVEAAAVQAKVAQVALDADAAAHPVVPAKVIVEPPPRP
jgi:hypothetical protein